jgi:predicted enzyme related to lactoylglutathione lyase
MTEISKFEPGMFCWVELATNDGAAAKSFYTSLFGWTANEIPMGPNVPPYVMLQKNAKDVAALYENKGIPPNWLSYVAVESVDDSAKTAKDLGANLLQEPFDVMDVGRMAVMQDPQGARLALWQARKHSGVGLRDEANTLCWNELMTSDVEAAQKFYGALFDWNLKITPGYTEVHVGEKPAGGLMQIAPEMQGMPPHWQPYFMVDDSDATLRKAQSLGTKEHFGPMDIPEVGRFAVLHDPQGAAFAVIAMNPRHGA